MLLVACSLLLEGRHIINAVDVRDLHPWQVDTWEARRIQLRLASQVVREGAPAHVQAIVGADIHVERAKARGAVVVLSYPELRVIVGADIHVERAKARGAVVVLSYPELRVIEQAIYETEVTFPYVPGLLSFRETPVLLGAFRQIETKPDLLLVDGQGYAHPRRFGLACHLGLILDVPAIGCAKSRLIGEHGPVGPAAGSRADLLDGGEVIGTVLRTRDGVSPLFVSVGHRIGLEEAAAWVLRCCRGYRLPEPTRLAHQAAGGRALPSASREPADQQMSLL